MLKFNVACAMTAGFCTPQPPAGGLCGSTIKQAKDNNAGGRFRSYVLPVMSGITIPKSYPVKSQ